MRWGDGSHLHLQMAEWDWRAQRFLTLIGRVTVFIACYYRQRDDGPAELPFKPSVQAFRLHQRTLAQDILMPSKLNTTRPLHDYSTLLIVGFR